jgi:hypothetical protein
MAIPYRHFGTTYRSHIQGYEQHERGGSPKLRTVHVCGKVTVRYVQRFETFSIRKAKLLTPLSFLPCFMGQNIVTPLPKAPPSHSIANRQQLLLDFLLGSLDP